MTGQFSECSQSSSRAIGTSQSSRRMIPESRTFGLGSILENSQMYRLKARKEPRPKILPVGCLRWVGLWSKHFHDDSPVPASALTGDRGACHMIKARHVAGMSSISE
ncbi:hypothetical protein BGAL_0419g00080 [Botrytis galanthina]|uniref:Uncharacterized protein n=1 Tax=Botrytis galanthina TaxID=278940 RepID=A0A4S8QRV7_9HELO|nr:hypothetical protein BGAL_0419g00080 [Botrytis galanthina]